MRKAQEKGPEAALETGVALALEVARELGDAVQGFHIATPGGSVEPAVHVLAGLDLP